MRSLLGFVVAALVAVGFAVPAGAVPLLLNYTFATTGKTASINLSGNLGGDGNTFVVTALNGYAVDGVPTAIGPFFDSADRAYGAPDSDAKLPTFTLDGSFVDFVIYAPGGQVQFVMAVDTFLADYASSVLGFTDGTAGALGPFGGNGPGAVNGFEQFQIANYSATLVGAGVPEPGTWALLLIGFGGAGVMLRRRRAVAVRPAALA